MLFILGRPRSRLPSAFSSIEFLMKRAVSYFMAHSNGFGFILLSVFLYSFPVVYAFLLITPSARGILV